MTELGRPELRPTFSGRRGNDGNAQLVSGLSAMQMDVSLVDKLSFLTSNSGGGRGAGGVAGGPGGVARGGAGGGTKKPNIGELPLRDSSNLLPPSSRAASSSTPVQTKRKKEPLHFNLPKVTTPAIVKTSRDEFPSTYGSLAGQGIFLL